MTIDNFYALKVLNESYCNIRTINGNDILEGIENLRQDGIFLEVYPKKRTYLIKSTGRVTHISVEDHDPLLAVMACSLLIKGMSFKDIQESIFVREEQKESHVQAGR